MLLVLLPKKKKNIYLIRKFKNNYNKTLLILPTADKTWAAIHRAFGLHSAAFLIFNI